MNSKLSFSGTRLAIFFLTAALIVSIYQNIRDQKTIRQLDGTVEKSNQAFDAVLHGMALLSHLYCQHYKGRDDIIREFRQTKFTEREVFDQLSGLKTPINPDGIDFVSTTILSASRQHYLRLHAQSLPCRELLYGKLLLQ